MELSMHDNQKCDCKQPPNGIYKKCVSAYRIFLWMAKLYYEYTYLISLYHDVLPFKTSPNAVLEYCSTDCWYTAKLFPPYYV